MKDPDKFLHRKKNGENWTGNIYHDPNDDRRVVRNRWGMGYTFNFAHPTVLKFIAYVALLGGIAALISWLLDI